MKTSTVNEVVLVNDIDVIRDTLASKGLALTLRIVAQAIRLNAEALQQGELTNKSIRKEEIIAEYERIAHKLDNQATGLEVNIKKMILSNSGNKGITDAATETEGTESSLCTTSESTE